MIFLLFNMAWDSIVACEWERIVMSLNAQILTFTCFCLGGRWRSLKELAFIQNHTSCPLDHVPPGADFLYESLCVSLVVKAPCLVLHQIRCPSHCVNPPLPHPLSGHLYVGLYAFYSHNQSSYPYVGLMRCGLCPGAVYRNTMSWL